MIDIEPVKAALVELLTPGISALGGEVLYEPPQTTLQVLGESGQAQLVYFGDTADGDYENVVFCDGGLRFDHTYIQQMFVLVLGRDSDDTQRVVDQRAKALYLAVVAELSRQGGWDHDELGLSTLAKLVVVPATDEWSGGQLGDRPTFACIGEIGLQVETRIRPT